MIRNLDQYDHVTQGPRNSRVMDDGCNIFNY